MPRLARVVVIGLLLACPAATAAQPETQAGELRPPVGWLATLRLASLERAESFATGVLDDLGYEFVSPLSTVLAIAGLDLSIVGEHEMLLGIGARGAGEPFPFLVLDPPDLDALVTALGGQRTGDAAVADIAGLRVAFSEYDGRVLAAPLAVEPFLLQPDLVAPPSQHDDAADLRLAVSAAGFAYLETRAGSFSNASRVAARRRLRSIDNWPPKLAQLDAAIGMNTFFWDELADQFRSAQLSAGRANDGRLVLLAVAERRQRLSIASAQPAQPPTDLFVADAVTELTASGLEAFLPTFIRLSTTYLRGRPDSIEAQRFSPAAYPGYQGRLETLAGLVSSADVRVVAPGKGEPVFANQMAVLTTTNADKLINAVTQTANSWNTLVKSSGARFRLLFEGETLDRDGFRGVQLTADLVKADRAIRDTPEIRDLQAKFVGEQGRMIFRAVRLSDNHVLLSDRSWEATVAVAQRFETPDPTARIAAPSNNEPQAAITWRIDRYLNWQAAIWRLMMQGTLGATSVPDMEDAPPVSIALTATDDQLDAQATVPRETLEAIGRYLKAKQKLASQQRAKRRQLQPGGR